MTFQIYVYFLGIIYLSYKLLFSNKNLLILIFFYIFFFYKALLLQEIKIVYRTI